MEPECNSPQSHWSPLVKGSNPLPPGDPIWALKVALWLPYAPPYAPRMVAFWLPYAPPLGCANVARPRDDLKLFSMIFIGFH